MSEIDQHVPGTCHSDQYCREYDGRNAVITSEPLCPGCLDDARRAVRALVYDYVDLAQLHEPAMSQAINEKTSGGTHESPTLLADHIEALQAEIVHVLSMWEYELRLAGRLSDPNTFAPLWRRAVYDHMNLVKHDPVLYKARAGTVVQRAVAIIAPRLDHLASLKLTLVCPTGVEDEPVYMFGWQAVHQFQALHGRARGVLGRTTRKFWIPGECWTCGARPMPGEDGPLYRSEPCEFEDEMQVNCSRCHNSRPYPDYETYMAALLWPNVTTDENVRVSA